jgi:oxalate decarboxylase/phosphoglucose isomerase-like protein (cupin superfamily)
VSIQPNAKTGAHHHGELESVIYVVRGKARMRWGERLEFTAEAGPGDFIYVPPFVPHQEINASQNEPLECVLVRSDNEAIVVNLPQSHRVLHRAGLDHGGSSVRRGSYRAQQDGSDSHRLGRWQPIGALRARCPPYPQKRTWFSTIVMSALCR